MKTFKTKLGTELPIMDIKGSPYLKVAHRIHWFREEHPDWTIETSLNWNWTGTEFAVVTATIRNHEGRIISMAHKYEDANDFLDFIEKAETGAIGRALALCGYGTQFAVDELDEGSRLADSPTIIPPKRSPAVAAKVQPNPVKWTGEYAPSKQAEDNEDFM